jgi:hypothetical protein
VITGFNTDIEHDGVVYHVQTEDKGLETPLILSLVYVGGAILASKRAPYEDLIAQGFSDEVLSERLKRQHKLICAAIASGRIEDLKKMAGRPVTTAPLRSIETVQVPESEPVSEPLQGEPLQALEIQQEIPIEDLEIPEIEEEAIDAEVAAAETEVDVFEIASIPSQVWSPPIKEEPPAPIEPELVAPVLIEEPHHEAYTVHDSRGHVQTFSDEGLTILLLNDDEFNSGESCTMRILVVNRFDGQERPLGSVPVSIKILGTAFRPQIYSLKTDREGLASVVTQIPEFTSGRAAVLVRAVIKEQAAELRRVIHPGK